MSSRDTFAALPPREQARVLGLIALLDALMGRTNRPGSRVPVTPPGPPPTRQGDNLMRQTQLSIFINRDTVIEASRVNGGSVVLALDPADYGTLNVFLSTYDDNTKAGALAQLARLTAAVEALPDDTHAGQGVLPTETLTRFCKYGDTIQKPCTHAECRPEYVPDLLGALDRSIQQARADRAAPVWRTLTFGDLRAGDVIKSDENGDEETVRAVAIGVAAHWIRTNKNAGWHDEEDPVLVRHPRPEVGQ